MRTSARAHLRPRLRAAAVVAVASAIAIAPIACVDLFHSTDFETLRDAAVSTDAVAPDATPDAGPKPIVDFCKWAPAEAKTNAARSCAWLGACGATLDEAAFGTCMVHALWAYDCDLNPHLRPHGATESLWSCLVDVKSCGEVDACLTGGARPTCTAVSGGSFTTCADGGPSGLRVECGNSETPLNFEPCAMQGRTCARIDTSASSCSGATTRSCAQGLGCTGTAAVDCRNVSGTLFDYGVDCAAFGAGQCVAGNLSDGGPVSACAPAAAAPACDGGIAVRCDQDFPAVAHSCVGGKDIAIDCAKLGVRCDVTGVPAYAPMKACAELVDAGRCIGADLCEGNKLRSCAQGISFEVDCAAAGLGACERAPNGTAARCAPR